MTKIHQFIEFRKHVDNMVKDGSIKGRVAILIYAIKERQRREINFRIPDPLNINDKYNDPAFPIFSAEGILDADDYAFFLDNLDADAYRKMLAHLISARIDNEFYSEHSRHWIKAFFSTALNSSGGHNPISISDMTVKLLELLLHVYQTPEKAAPIYAKLVEKFTRPEDYKQVLYSNILSIVDTIKSANSYKTSTSEYYQPLVDIEALANSARDKLPDNKVCIAELFKTYGLAYWRIKTTLRDEIDLSSEQRQIFESRMAHLHERVEHYATKMNAVLGMGANSALELYANRNTQKGGSLIPAKMEISISVLKGMDIDETLRKEMATQMLVKLLNGSLKYIDKQGVNTLAKNLSSMVDWEVAIAKLNEQGRHQVIASGVDSNFYLKHLTESKDRLLVLHQDMGM